MTVLRQIFEVPREVEEVRSVRVRIDVLLQEFGCAFACELCALLATELVTNAIRHGQGAITLTTECVDQQRVRITVHDQGRGRPRVLRPEPTDPDGGRGLLLVEALSDAWGVDRDPAGTGVWFDVCQSAG